jgi:hypothetical protein
MTMNLSQARSIRAYVVSVTMAFILLAARGAGAVTIEGPFLDPYSGMNLYVLPLGTWTQSESAAQQLGGNLMTISSSAENQFVVNNVLQDFTGSGGPSLSDLPLWIGLYDPTGAAHDDGPGGAGSQHAANFLWVDGSSSAYRNWNSSTNEPTDSSPGEYYSTINWHTAQGTSGVVGTWNDTPLAGTTGYGGNSNGPYYGIAAVPVPEPSALALLGLIGVAGFGWRRRAKV